MSVVELPVLSPLAFILFINDVLKFNILSTHMLMNLHFLTSSGIPFNFPGIILEQLIQNAELLTFSLISEWSSENLVVFSASEGQSLNQVGTTFQTAFLCFITLD